LALPPLAVVRMVKLAAAGAAELQALRSPVLLVAQPQKHHLQRVRAANNPGTNHVMGRARK
jgi:hypothetical protein